MRFLRVVLAASPRRHLALVASTAAVLVAFPATASAKTTIYGSTFDGTAATASFATVQGCTGVSVEVTANNGTNKDTVTGKRAFSVVTAFINGFDYCTELGFYSYGSVDLASGQFTVDQKLGSARLTATVPPISSDIPGNIEIDLTWTATTDPLSSRQSGQVTYPDGSKLIFRVSGTYRDASASGVVSVGDLNFSPNPAYIARIWSTTSGSLSLTK